MDILSDRHSQARWLEDSQTSRKTYSMDRRLFIAYCQANVKFFIGAFSASWVTPKDSNYWTDKRPNWKTEYCVCLSWTMTVNWVSPRGSIKLKVEVEEAEILPSNGEGLIFTCPTCSPESRGVWRKLKKMSGVDVAGSPWSGCFSQKTAKT